MFDEVSSDRNHNIDEWWVYYRPQRSCGKVMFLHVSVILSTGGGYLPLVLGGCLSLVPGETHPLPGQTPPWADTPPDVQCMLGYGQQAGGTHPTGMHSCIEILSLPRTGKDLCIIFFVSASSWLCTLVKISEIENPQPISTLRDAVKYSMYL